MKQVTFSMLVVALVVGVVLIGCPPPAEPEPDTESPMWVYSEAGEAKAALEGMTVSYVPDGKGGFDIAREIGAAPMDMTGADVLDVSAGYANFPLGDGNIVTLYDVQYDDAWVGQNGSIAFGDEAPAADAKHTKTVGISALRADLAGGVVSATVANDTLVVDWAGVTTVAKQAGMSSFQVQAHLDTSAWAGIIDVIYEEVAADLDKVVVGVSSAESGSRTNVNPNTDAAKSAL